MEVNYQANKLGDTALMVGHVYLINDKLYLCVDCESSSAYYYDLVELETGKGIYLNSLGLDEVDNGGLNSVKNAIISVFDSVDVTDDVKVVAK